jgi:hypothetical protein
MTHANPTTERMQRRKQPTPGKTPLERAEEAQSKRKGVFAELERHNKGFTSVVPTTVMHHADLEALTTDTLLIRRGFFSTSGEPGVRLTSVQEAASKRVLAIGVPGAENTLLPIPTEHLKIASRLYRELCNPGHPYREPQPANLRPG